MPELKENIVDVYFETEKGKELFAKISTLMSFANVTTDNVDQIISSMGANLQSRFPVLMLMSMLWGQFVTCREKYFMKKFRKQSKSLDLKKTFEKMTHSKINAVVQKIEENKNNGKKKLVFCLFIKEMERLQKVLEKKGISCGSVSGSTPKKMREQLLRKPEEGEESPDVLIVQIQTACEGLNLQHISEVYFSLLLIGILLWKIRRLPERIELVRKMMLMFTDLFLVDSQLKDDDHSITLDEYCMNIQEKERNCENDFVKSCYKICWVVKFFYFMLLLFLLN